MADAREAESMKVGPVPLGYFRPDQVRNLLEQRRKALRSTFQR